MLYAISLRELWKRLCNCENEAETDYYHGSAISQEIGLLVATALHNGWLIDLAQWFLKYWSKPKRVEKGQKMGRAEATQTGIVDFQSNHCLSVSVIAQIFEKRVDCWH